MKKEDEKLEDKEMEGKREGPGLKFTLCIFSSVFLNIVFGCYIHLFAAGEQSSSGWSSPAAVEAEAVAAISCSGHGRAYLDSVVVDGEHSCECHTCYAGEDCSLLLPACPADANSGDPMFLEPYWRQNAAVSAVLIAGWHRMSYEANGENFISLELERHLRLLHDAVGNAVTRDLYMVFGAGSTQLINAAVYALSPAAVNINGSSPALVVATAPFYRLYKKQTELFDSRENKWDGITSNLANLNASSGANFIEFVTSPNNPDGMLKRSVIEGSSVIFDHSYYWPHYTAIPTPADEHIMLFTISKLTGHAGSRFGWALVKDRKIYKKMVDYLKLNTMGVSRDTQLRILKLLKVILPQVGREGDIFKFAYETVNEKWSKLSNVISSSSRFSLQSLLPQYCTYFHKIRDPSPAFAWLKCEREEDTDCEAVLREAGIISRPGVLFESESRYTRLSLIKTKDDFDQLLSKIEALVSKEKFNIM